MTVCFNAEKTIRRTIDSVLAQTYPNLEYLVVDGGSTDGTLAILRSYEGRLSFTSEPDRGMYDAMNKGIRRARGKWIHLVNADDWYATPDALALAVPQLAEDRTNYFDLVRVYPDREPVLQSRTVSRWMLYIAAFLPHPTLIVSREQYERIGLYDPELRIASDHDLILRMIRYFPPKHSPIGSLEHGPNGRVGARARNEPRGVHAGDDPARRPRRRGAHDPVAQVVLVGHLRVRGRHARMIADEPQAIRSQPRPASAPAQRHRPGFST